MGALHRLLGAAVQVLDRVAELGTSLALVAIVMINGMEIVGRTFFSHSFIWLYETNLLLGNWLYFLGICLVYARNGDITVDALLRLFGDGAQRVYLILVNAAGILTLAVIAWFGWELIKLQMPFRSVGFGIPNPLFSAPVMVSAVLMAVILVKQTLDLWRDGRVTATRGLADGEAP